ncbi:hypothetical protein VTN00DRAFT_6636 [Thermoascus crustaceus]|uniref:uncharacterized protein n=1 Tax=Thermoascus crustaceus TaxID=5088 RepID=UPI003742D7C9
MRLFGIGRKRRRRESSPHPLPRPRSQKNQVAAPPAGQPTVPIPYEISTAAYSTYTLCTVSQSYQLPQSQPGPRPASVPPPGTTSPNLLYPHNAVASTSQLSVASQQSSPPASQYGLSQPPGRRQKSPSQRSTGRSSRTDLSSLASQTMDLTHNVIDEVDERVSNCVHKGTELLDVTMEITDHAIDKVEDKVFEYVQEGKNVFSKKVDEVITAMDEGLFRHEWDETDVYPTESSMHGRDEHGHNKPSNRKNTQTAQTNYFSKVHLYANSRLPPDLPPLKIHSDTYPLLRLAAKYSLRAYAIPAGSERASHVDPDWRHGTKAMVIKSIPIDHMNTIVFAVRGTMSFRDWAVNMHTHPTAPAGFLDDTRNLCHEGFLDVARRMVHPVAERLESLLREKPNRASCSLLMTGHSAGGAVASLLYCHMLSERVQSKLTHLRGFFKSVHCVTFGAPPVSLLPLQKPPTEASHNSIFLSFINEGDPVARADKAYVRSLLDLCISPAPGSTLDRVNSLLRPRGFVHLRELIYQKDRLLKDRRRLVLWKVPRATLSAAGWLIVLRKPVSASKHGRESRSLRKYAQRRSLLPVRESESDSESDSDSQEEEEIEAVTTTDEQLRGVVFGDPLMHSMILYAKRIEILAREAEAGG